LKLINANNNYRQSLWLKWFCEAAGGGAHLTKPVWSRPHIRSTPTNLALFGHKITLYRFNQGAHTIAGGSNRSRVS